MTKPVVERVLFCQSLWFAFSELGLAASQTRGAGSPAGQAFFEDERYRDVPRYLAFATSSSEPT